MQSTTAPQQYETAAHQKQEQILVYLCNFRITVPQFLWSSAGDGAWRNKNAVKSPEKDIELARIVTCSKFHHAINAASFVSFHPPDVENCDQNGAA
jgi:hypothetical protein